MSGALVVDGIDELFPLLRGLPERFFLIKHFKCDDESEIVSINGQINPAIAMRVGEMQFWRIAHIGASDFYKLRIEGMPLYVVATDGHALSQPRKMTELFIGPGERIDAIVIGPPAGEYPMRTISFQNEAWRPPEPVRQLAVIHSSSGLSQNAEIEDEIINDVRIAPIARRRTLTYSRTTDRKIFMIDGRVVDEARTDQTVKLGYTEEWTVVNTDQQYHSFHIHQTPFLVTEVGGLSCHDDSLRDTFQCRQQRTRGPARSRSSYRSLTRQSSVQSERPASYPRVYGVSAGQSPKTAFSILSRWAVISAIDFTLSSLVNWAQLMGNHPIAACFLPMIWATECHARILGPTILIDSCSRIHAQHRP